MKILGLAFFVCLLTCTSWAREKRGLLLDLNFQLKDAKKSLQMKNQFILAQDSNEWAPVAPAKDGVVLLAKFEKPIQGVFKVQYMVVDTTSTPVGLHSLSVTSMLNEETKISSTTDNGEGVTISMTAKETAYREEKK